MERLNTDFTFYRGKNILITGHTGFKGVWLCKVLLKYGANIIGYSLKNSSNLEFFNLSSISSEIIDIDGDIRDLNNLKKVFNHYQPEIVFHLAAQALVRDSYFNPVYTYETNVMGTVNILECIREASCVKSFVNITTDKVYKNNEWEWPYRENDILDGYDPYSNSKSCSELVTHSYVNSFFQNENISVSTVRAGNVIGGGDFSKDRIIPDCVRAIINNNPIIIRNPLSIRPYQHVLDPIFAYIVLAMKQYDNKSFSGNYNIGPEITNNINTLKLVELFSKFFDDNVLRWKLNIEENQLHEANTLLLDISKFKKMFGWKPTLDIESSLNLTAQFVKAYISNENISKEMQMEINYFESKYDE